MDIVQDNRQAYFFKITVIWQTFIIVLEERTAPSSALKTELSVYPGRYWITYHHIPEKSNFHCHCCENPIFKQVLFSLMYLFIVFSLLFFISYLMSTDAECFCTELPCQVQDYWEQAERDYAFEDTRSCKFKECSLLILISQGGCLKCKILFSIICKLLFCFKRLNVSLFKCTVTE